MELGETKILASVPSGRRGRDPGCLNSILPALLDGILFHSLVCEKVVTVMPLDVSVRELPSRLQYLFSLAASYTRRPRQLC